MYNNYEAGSQYWIQIGNLSNEEKTALITAMETDIIRSKKGYPDEYFYWLIVNYEEAKNDAHTFDEFKKNNYYIEKLEWLRHKNTALDYKQKLDEILNQQGKKLPMEKRIELQDAYTTLLSMYYNK